MNFLDNINVLSLLPNIKRRKVFQYEFKNQEESEGGTWNVHDWLRQYYPDAAIEVVSLDDGTLMLQTILNFTEIELGYLQAIHDFGHSLKEKE